MNDSLDEKKYTELYKMAKDLGLNKQFFKKPTKIELVNALKAHFETLNAINRQKEKARSAHQKKNLILDLTIREAGTSNLDGSKTSLPGTIIMQQTLLLQDDRNLNFVLTKIKDGSYRFENVLATGLEKENNSNQDNQEDLSNNAIKTTNDPAPISSSESSESTIRKADTHYVFFKTMQHDNRFRRKSFVFHPYLTSIIKKSKYKCKLATINEMNILEIRKSLEKIRKIKKQSKT